ncbi:hypothetical protein [Actinomadura alba]|uniref:Uncharacterized protein n=1 Tax=Actinomadura alba TaxID=406431 RepID=A0ABR7LHM1_9ACTN|nr:hypothetical protein [Actinomadura alba]MBC6464244.1 hypothetical protein [Actinomadura alba]
MDSNDALDCDPDDGFYWDENNRSASTLREIGDLDLARSDTIAAMMAEND